jgi:hypothetical protein
MDADLTTPHRVRAAAVLVAVGLLTAGCAGDGAGSGDVDPAAAASTSSGAEFDTADADHPDVVAAELRSEGDGTWTLDVTISSEYDSAERYADGWRVLSPQGDVLGEHELTHDHAGEQPFTRTQTGLEIPEGVSTLTIEGRDTENGYGGGTLEVAVPAG